MNLVIGLTNSAEVEQEPEQSNECGLAICANVIGGQTQLGVATVTNAFDTFGNDLFDSNVINSAEVEQETEQSNECGLAICANVIRSQSQVGVAAVTNIDDLLDNSNVINSAEVEQEMEQSNECGLAICANVIGVQVTDRRCGCYQYN